MASRLLRAALSGKVEQADVEAAEIAGFRPFNATGSKLVTNEQIDKLRDQVGL